ncbi:hypothetical protein TNCV_766361 [Trichonephila clavipes]|nr:hypothetical protein TNCV_766361 [Trichonephila clavipes]
MVKRQGRHLSWQPPLLTTTPHQREDVSALNRFSVHRCPTQRVFSGTGRNTFEWGVTRMGSGEWDSLERDTEGAHNLEIHCWGGDRLCPQTSAFGEGAKLTHVKFDEVKSHYPGVVWKFRLCNVSSGVLIT